MTCPPLFELGRRKLVLSAALADEQCGGCCARAALLKFFRVLMESCVERALQRAMVTPPPRDTAAEIGIILVHNGRSINSQTCTGANGRP